MAPVIRAHFEALPVVNEPHPGKILPSTSLELFNLMAAAPGMLTALIRQQRRVHSRDREGSDQDHHGLNATRQRRLL